MKQLFDFKGRIRRSSYVKRIILFAILSGIPIMIFVFSYAASLDINCCYILLLCLIPFWGILSTCVKRCHDLDLSGIYSVIPIYGAVIMLFFEGTSGTNKYGPDPKS
jgi:uncharacterized membrane protein YhaH (DUF805 family)